MEGVVHDGSEKSSLGPEMVNMITANMRQPFPGFRFYGELLAQGEDIDDRWRLVIGEDGIASKVACPKIGERITCPHCEQAFILEAGAMKARP